MIKRFLFILCVMSLFGCSQDKLVVQKTADDRLVFKLSSDFISNSNFNVFNEIQYTTDIYDNGDYKLYIDVYLAHYPHLEKLFEGYKSEKATYDVSGYTIKKSEKVNIVPNENGYDFVAFYGVVKDKSVLLPSYYGVHSVMIKTPKYFVSIELKQHARRLGALDRDKSMNYLTPIIKTMK